MIPASSYDFVNVPAGFIKGAGAGFVSRSPLPTLEDAAYMREIYRTVKCREGYRMNEYGDSWTVGAGQKDDIPMMPRQERWEGDLAEISTILGNAGYTFQNLRPARFDTYQFATSQHWDPGYVPTLNEFDPAKFWARLASAVGPVITTPASRLMSHDDVKAGYTTAINALRSWNTAWPWYCNMTRHGGGKITSHLGGLEDYFIERESEWQKNGSSTTETPTSFISEIFSNSYRPSYWTQRSNSGTVTTWSLEGSWTYRIAEPPFTHGRINDGALFATPIWRILITRLWNVTNQSTGTVSRGVTDKKIHEIYWHGSPLDIAISRTYGQRVTITVLVGESGGTSTSANGSLILSSSGAVNFATPTSPSGSLPTYHSESVDGYDADISLAAVIFTNYRGTRNLRS